MTFAISTTIAFHISLQDIKYIDVALTPRTASNNPFPKQFYVDLKNPTNNARYVCFTYVILN